MDPSALIPTPETIPAPAWLFLVLEQLFFIIHILLVNVILGGLLIAIYSGFKQQDQPFGDALYSKLPTTFALGINQGVAPLLFMQVIYGHLFYSSSVLMAVYWILIIPLLILAYYGAYIYVKKYGVAPVFSKTAAWISAIIVLYIGFIFVNNLSLMVEPQNWSAYFENRWGTLLNMSDATIFPRYLHFIFASLAVAGLFGSLVWKHRSKTTSGMENKIAIGLKIFAYATLLQALVGIWYLLVIPREFMLQFMGRDIISTVFFMLGFIGAIAAIILALANKTTLTLYAFAITMLSMVVMRFNLRGMYLGGFFDWRSLQVDGQIGAFIVFIIALLIGVAAIIYMLKLALTDKQGRAA